MLENVDSLIEKANNGDTISQYLLGVTYAKGENVDQNGKLAVYWYLEAASKLYPPAIWNAGIMIYEGEAGVHEDPILGLKLIERAASLGDSSACLFLANCYRFGLENKKIDIEKAERLEFDAFNSKPVEGEVRVINFGEEFGMVADKDMGYRKKGHR